MMKTRNLFFGAILMAFAGSFTACNEADATIEDLEGDLKSAETAALNCPISGTVTDEEATGILYMWEEEKMAHDVYLYFNNIYKTVPFSNIMGSESVHMLAVERLITGFGLTNTGNTETGKFNITDLSDLYAELTLAGEKSLVDALAAGALIEETDIADLRTLLLTTKNASVAQVYTNLARASENHLRAFVNALKAQGATYTPQVLTVEYYNAILAGTSGRFGKGKGKGPGFGTGTGTCVQPGAQLGKQYRRGKTN